MRSACGGMYQKKDPYKNVTATDRYLGFDYGLNDFNNHNYTVAMKRFLGGITETRQGYGNQEPYYLAMEYVYLGMCKQRTGDLAGAIGDFKLALEIDSDINHSATKAALTRIGQCLAMLKDHKNALYFYDKMLSSTAGAVYQASDPMFSALNSDRAYYLRAVSRFALGNIPGAKEDCLNALKLRKQQYPKAAKFLQQLGGAAPNNSSGSGMGDIKEQVFGPNGQFSEKIVPLMPAGGIVDFNKPQGTSQNSSSATPPTAFAMTPEKQQQLERIAIARLQEQNAHEVALRELVNMFPPMDEPIKTEDIDYAMKYIQKQSEKMCRDELFRAE